MTSLSLRQVALGDMDQELAATRRVLERIPDEQLDWKPHEKSMSLGALSSHIVNIPFLVTAMLSSDTFDFAANPPDKKRETRAELLTRFDSLSTQVGELMSRADDEALNVTWAARSGNFTVFEAPRVVAIRTMGLSHLIHHRAQLTVYLRQIGVPIPGLYGPSADE